MRGELIEKKEEVEENPSEETHLQIYGARVHNLQNIDISIPRDKLVVITGLSGSGKSSLALIPFMPRVSAVIWKPFRLMRDSLLVIWSVLMWIKLRV